VSSATAPLVDITDAEGIRLLVAEFYSRAFRDELLGPVFVDVAQMDLDAHLPVMVEFWSTVLLGARSYRGGAFAPHARLHAQVPLTRRHFDRWLAIWHATVDDLFAGRVADDAKLRAAAIADAFCGRLTQPARGPVCAYRYAGPGADDR
jgi:hemoglobin